MSLSEKDIKILWGRAASRCAFPGCRVSLTHDKVMSSDVFPLGEQAHIVAEESRGPRGDSQLSTPERNTYSNYILLCPTHHTLIDKDVEGFPIERLHTLKAEHELWVEQTLSNGVNMQKQAHDLIYSSLINAAVECCQFDNWDRWTYYALMQPPVWDVNAPDQVETFQQKILGAVWPGSFPEIERALETLSLAISQALAVFTLHSDLEGDTLKGIKFYKIQDWNPSKYTVLIQRYHEWLEECEKWIFETARAANWLADLVRDNINPLFFAKEGKFWLKHGPYGPDMGYKISLYEYTEEEKKALPNSLAQLLASKQKKL